MCVLNIIVELHWPAVLYSPAVRVTCISVTLNTRKRQEEKERLDFKITVRRVFPTSSVHDGINYCVPSMQQMQSSFPALCSVQGIGHNSTMD